MEGMSIILKSLKIKKKIFFQLDKKFPLPSNERKIKINKGLKKTGMKVILKLIKYEITSDGLWHVNNEKDRSGHELYIRIKHLDRLRY